MPLDEIEPRISHVDSPVLHLHFQGAFKALASLGANDEDIRKRVRISEDVLLMY